jgi:hypothetical protein
MPTGLFLATIWNRFHSSQELINNINCNIRATRNKGGNLHYSSTIHFWRTNKAKLQNKVSTKSARKIVNAHANNTTFLQLERYLVNTNQN